MGEHLWTPAERRAQLSQIRSLSRTIKKKYRTDAFDEIIGACDRFLKGGFTDQELAAFSRSVGNPPGWVDTKADAYMERSIESPGLMDQLRRMRELLEDLRSKGYWE